MPERVPVTRSDDRQPPCVEACQAAIHGGQHRLTAGDGKVATGQEVALQVDHQQGIARLRLQARWRPLPFLAGNWLCSVVRHESNPSRLTAT